MYHQVPEGEQYDFCPESEEEINLRIEYLQYKLEEKDRQNKQLENEKSGLERELGDTKEALDQVTDQFKRLTTEIKTMKEKYVEVRVEDAADPKKEGTTEQMAQLRLTENKKFPEMDQNELDEEKADLVREISKAIDSLQNRTNIWNKSKSELEAENERLKSEVWNGKLKIEQLGNEKTGLEIKLGDTKEELDQVADNFTRLTTEIRAMKEKYVEVRAEDAADPKKKDIDDDDAPEKSDECLFDYEYENFKQQFTELQKKASYLSQKCFSTRSSKLIGEVTRRLVPSTEISDTVGEEVVKVLQKGSAELKGAVDDLTSLEAQLPTTSSNKKITDAKLLD